MTKKLYNKFSTNDIDIEWHVLLLLSYTINIENLLMKLGTPELLHILCDQQRKLHNFAKNPFPHTAI